MLELYSLLLALLADLVGQFLEAFQLLLGRIFSADHPRRWWRLGIGFVEVMLQFLVIENFLMFCVGGRITFFMLNDKL